jgi:hypothetical protein
MAKSKLVPMMISLPKEYRDKLRTMAAEQNFNNPDQVTSAATIAKEIICERLSIDREAKEKETKRETIKQK